MILESRRERMDAFKYRFDDLRRKSTVVNSLPAKANEEKTFHA